MVFLTLIKRGFRISLWLSGPVSASMDIRVSLRRPSRLLFHSFFLVHLEGWFENPPSNTTAAAFLYGSPLMNLDFVGEQDNSRRLVLGTAKECLYTPGMSRKPRACIEDTWSFKNYTDT